MFELAETTKPIEEEIINTDLITHRQSTIVDDKILTFIQPALNASLAPGRREQKKSHMEYWKLFCQQYEVDKDKFGKALRKYENVHDKIRNEAHIIDGLSILIVLLPRRKRTKYKSTEHA